MDNQDAAPTMEGISMLPNGATTNGTNGHANGKRRVASHIVVTYPLTDIGNADRLIHYHGADLRYCYQAKRWYVWDTTKWAEDRSGEIDRRAENVTLRILDEAQRAENSDERKKLSGWAHKTMFDKPIKNMIGRACSKAPLAIEELDTDSYLLNCRNGTLNLRIGALQSHSRTDYITKSIPIAYDPQACCPHWNDFVYSIMEGRDHLVSYLQRAIGYALTGDTRERVIFFFHGGGSNGKSTFLDIIGELMAEYGQQMDAETITIKKTGGIPNDIARLRGARFVAASETEEGKRLAESRVKQLTGGDTITARFLNQEFFEFKPQFKIFLATNHKPVITGTDKAIWDRIALIPFDVRFWDTDKGETGKPELAVNKKLGKILRDELPGILNWALKGCLLWQESGLGAPEEVRSATATYRSEMDTLQIFFEDHCKIAPTATCKNGDLYRTYTRWADEAGEFKQSQKWLTQRLKERGFEQARDMKSRLWQGIGIQDGQQELV